jgi:hypothetical protein
MLFAEPLYLVRYIEKAGSGAGQANNLKLRSKRMKSSPDFRSTRSFSWSKSEILPVTPMSGAKRDRLKFEKLASKKGAERLGSAFPRGTWERAKKQPPIK